MIPGSPEWIIRPAAPADASAMVAILDGVGAEGLMAWDPDPRMVARTTQALDHPDSTQALWVVAQAQTQTIGGTAEAIQGSTPKTAGVVTVALALAPMLRHQGWGLRLMATMEAWALQRQAHKISLVCLRDNTPAIGLYARLGYQVEGTWAAHYWMTDHWVDAVWWAKFLS